MKKFKKLLRTIGFVLLVLLAATGIGMVPIFFNKKERDFDNQINVEQVDEKEEDDETTLKEVIG